LEFVQENQSEKVAIDYSKAKFTHPFLSAGISGIIEKLSPRVSLVEKQFENGDIQNYMTIIEFPLGLHYRFPFNTYLNTKYPLTLQKRHSFLF
jgi:hypothetical protein